MQNKRYLPEICKRLDGASYRANKSGCVGFFPFTMQTVFNKYATGIRGISFEIRQRKLYLTYEEGEATFTFPIGFDKAERSVIDVGGDAFRIACRAKADTDLRGRTVLTLKCDFLELPATRLLTLTLTHKGAELRQSELPGKGLIGSILRSQAAERPDNIILSSLLERSGEEAFEFKLDRLFEPTVYLEKI